MRVGKLAQGLVVLLWSISVLDISWSSARITLLIGSILGGVCMFSGLFVLQATSAFWTIESLEIWNATTYGGLEAARYPLTIYGTWLRRFFTYVVPLGFISYIPALAILGRSGNLINWLAPAIGVIFLFTTLQVWKIGVRHYCSTGS
jgi:ABC-2 type transport system permease protein